MDHPLSVVVQIERDTRCVHLVVTGDRTERNHRTLTPHSPAPASRTGAELGMVAA